MTEKLSIFVTLFPEWNENFAVRIFFILSSCLCRCTYPQILFLSRFFFCILHFFFFLSLLLRVLVPFFSLSFLLFLSAGCCLKFRSIFHHPFLEFRPFYCERKRHATFLIFCVSVPQRCFNFSSFPLAVFHPDNATPFLTCTPRNTL